jgi:hypothetical protein
VDEINSKTAGAGGDDALLDHEELLRRNTQNLMSAVSSLPELQVGVASLFRTLLRCCLWVRHHTCSSLHRCCALLFMVMACVLGVYRLWWW